VKIDDQEGKNLKFFRKCNNCGLQGHTGRTCREKEENKHRRPANWKKRTEKGLTVMKVKKDEKIVKYGWILQDKFQVEDPTIWIADTGAKGHSTPHLELLSDCNPQEENVTVVMGNGNEEKVTNVDTVKGEAINKSGELQGLIDLSGVMFLKNGCYILLSVTKIMNAGWKLQGDESSISLEIKDKKLTFDIKIHTTRGVLFAVKIKQLEVNAIVKELPEKVKEMSPIEAH
jgi:hypothetical protein